MIRKIILAAFTPVVLFLAGCANGFIPGSSGQADLAVGDRSALDDVQIRDKGTYYEVVLDYTHGATPRQIGTAYGLKIMELVPDFERIVDSYIQEITFSPILYQILLYRTASIKQNIDPEYQAEISGMASVFSGGALNQWGDGRISQDEAFLLNFMGDVWRVTECSAVSVWGPRSATGKTLTARLFDFGAGGQNQLNRIPAVTTIKHGDKSVCLIGYLGYMGAITGFNPSGVFAGVLDCQAGTQLATFQGKRSYIMDLRHALENASTLDEVGQYMIDPAKSYTFNHLVFLSDPTGSKVVENNFSGTGSHMRRALRSSDSELNDNVPWGIDHAIAAVNAFVLKGNHDNFNGMAFNYMRWESFRNQLLAAGGPLTFDQLRQIATYHTGDLPGDQSNGDIYNGLTLTIVLSEPDSRRLEVFFRPKDGILPAQPIFEKIDVNF